MKDFTNISSKDWELLEKEIYVWDDGYHQSVTDMLISELRSLRNKFDHELFLLSTNQSDCNKEYIERWQFVFDSEYKRRRA